LGEESREIEEGLRRSHLRDRFELRQQWAVRPQDLQRAILDNDPQIIHFAGHGAGEKGIVLQDEDGSAKAVSADALGSLFGLYPQVECVLLNACYSELQAEAIVKHVRYVIGMNQAIGDEAAITFATAFYDALGAGKPIDFAFKSGSAAIQMAGIPEHLTPVLKCRDVLSAIAQPSARGTRQPARRTSGESARQTDAFDKVKGTIKDPIPGQLVRPTFHCSGTVSGMDSALSLWLAVEVGGLVWPKESRVVVDQDGTWSVTVFEDGAASEFAVGLFLGDSAVDGWILKWLQRGRRTGNYQECKGIPGARRLDRVDGLRLELDQHTGVSVNSTSAPLDRSAVLARGSVRRPDAPATQSASAHAKGILQRQLQWYEETSELLAVMKQTIEIAWTLEETEEDEGARRRTWHQVQQHYLGLEKVLNKGKLLGSQRTIGALSRLVERFDAVSDQTEGFDESELAASHNKLWKLRDPLERANKVLRSEWRRLSGIDP
jgi:hypothetical protein